MQSRSGAQEPDLEAPDLTFYKETRAPSITTAGLTLHNGTQSYM